MNNMVLTCSPQQEAPVLRFHSPSHLHGLDASSTLLQLRRSLSRSPSKSPAFRLVSSRAPPPGSPLASSSFSPRRGAARLQVSASAHNLRHRSPPPISSRLASDVPQTTRAGKVNPRKTSPLRPSQRNHITGRFQTPKRVLGESSDSGNAAPFFAMPKSSGLENQGSEADVSQSIVKPPKTKFQGFGSVVDTTGSQPQSDQLQPPQSPFSFRSELHGIRLADAPVKSSPLKRVEAPSRTDSAGATSPSAKRRSLQSSADFDIFEQFAATEGSATSRTSPDALPTLGVDENSLTPPISKRSSALRKSTIQQRYERPILSRAKASSNLAHDFTSAASPTVRPANNTPEEPRSPLPTRRSLFASDPDGSNGAAGLNEETTAELPRAPVRHPLSRTMTQSSSGSDAAQDSPTHVPMRAPPNRKPMASFAKSLPLGAMRETVMQRSDTAAPSAVETPADYKLAKPLQAAFHSTGLISKRTKDLREESTIVPGTNMPDTPCKRPAAVNPMAVQATPAPAPRHAQLRRPAPEFGSPSAPFHASNRRPTPGANGKGVGIFGSSIKPLNRRGSFLSADSDETALDAMMIQAVEVPSTPSKPANIVGARFLGSEVTNQGGLENPYAAAKTLDSGKGTPEPVPPCKFTLSCPDDDHMHDPDGDSSMEESPSAQRRFASLGALSSFYGNRRPTILGQSASGRTRKASTLPHIRTGNLHAKRTSLSPASPSLDRAFQGSPCTPKDGKDFVAPPDPSGLSISAQHNQVADLRQSTFGRSVGPGSIPPATPTANRDSHRFQSHRLAQSSAHAIAEAQVDPSLRSRFDDIEMIGDGEFSSVFKVTKKAEGVQEDSAMVGQVESGSRSSSLTPRPTRIYAVKKSRSPYLGQKDRAHKLKEVQVLRSLGSSAHTIEFLDHWEHEGHLYIQTEYCEEGSLAHFLKEAGKHARLDDFRIWKILVEATLGLKHIHDSGFMHLDLKPANILVTFDGSLKIADFGMASSWPAAPGIEAEGDREYIGPEVLLGIIDKPSDIFALGLIIFEIAGNVMLPDNGASWQRLRQGIISDVPSLTSAADVSIPRDDNGMPIIQDFLGESTVTSPPKLKAVALPLRKLRRCLSPPPFMIDSRHPASLESIVQWMIKPDPASRPTVDHLLQADSCSWINHRRRVPATVYEGVWGCEVDTVAVDTEMMDV